MSSTAVPVFFENVTLNGGSSFNLTRSYFAVPSSVYY